MNFGLTYLRLRIYDLGMKNTKGFPHNILKSLFSVSKKCVKGHVETFVIASMVF